MKKKNNKGSIEKKIAIGAGAVAAGAAAYMLLGPDGKENRAKVAKFAQNISKKVQENKDVKNIKKEIGKIVDAGKAKTKKAVNKAKTKTKAQVKAKVA